VQQFVGQAVRDYKLQSACNCDQKLVVIGIAALGLIANSEAITNGRVSVSTAVPVSKVVYHYLRREAYVFVSFW